MPIRIANAAGFWGDDPDAPRRLLAGAQVDYLTLEYLAELTMSILAHQRSRDPKLGYATDFVAAMNDIIPFLLQDARLKIVTDAGGMNPSACAIEVARLLHAAGLSQLPIAVVSGDDLLPQWRTLSKHCEFRNLDTGLLPSESGGLPASANAYLGARPIVDGLSAGARIVITGRVADASLTLGPAMHEFGWSWDDWDRMAAATVAGHLIECGAQVTGGYSNRWREWEMADIGFPIAELSADGAVVLTKPDSSGGRIDRQSVVEQLVYEIGDPENYLTPDVVADFTTVTVREIGPNQVQVSGATGRPATDQYKVSVAYPAGFTASAMLLVRGTDAIAKARFAGELVLERLRRRNITFHRTNLECLGAGDGIPSDPAPSNKPSPSTEVREIVLRLSVQDPCRSSVERFTKEIATLITSGPCGLAGYAAGRPSVRPVLAYWPTLVPKERVPSQLETRTAQDWCRGADST